MTFRNYWLGVGLVKRKFTNKKEFYSQHTLTLVTIHHNASFEPEFDLDTFLNNNKWWVHTSERRTVKNERNAVLQVINGGRENQGS